MRAIQATPSGFLVDLDDGSEPRLWPEHIAVRAGLVPPTPGAYQQPIGNVPAAQDPAMGMPDPGAVPNLGVAPLEAPTVPPPPPVTPDQPAGPPNTGFIPSNPHSAGYSTSTHSTEFVRRNDVQDVGFDSKPYEQGLAEQGAAMNAAYARQHELINKRADLDLKADQVLHGTFDDKGNLVKNGLDQDQAAQMRADAKERATVDAEVAQHVQSEQARIDANLAAVPQEDPRRIWHDNSAFQNAAGLFAAFAGGMLAVTTGSGRNMGLEAIERAIERDVQAQRTNIESQFKKIAHDENSLQAYQQFKANERAHLLEGQIYRLETLKLDRLAEASKFSSPSKQAELQGQAAALDAVQAGKRAELIEHQATVAKAAADDRLQLERLKLEKRVASSQIAENYAQADAANAQAGAARNKAPLVLSDRTGMTVRGPDGKPALYQPRNEDEKKALDSLGTTALNQHTILSALKEFYKTDPSSWSPEARGRVASLLGQYVMSGGEKLGRMTDKDAEMLQAAAGGNPLKFANALQSLGASTKAIEDTMEANRSRYEVGAQQINRDIRVKMPDPDPVLMARFGPQEASVQDSVGNSSLQLSKAFSGSDPKRKVEALEGLESSLTASRVAGSGAPDYLTEGDVKHIEKALADLAKIPAQQRAIPTPQGGTEDALERLRRLREYMNTKIATQGLVGRMNSESQTLGAGERDGYSLFDKWK